MSSDALRDGPRVAWVTNDLPPHSGGIQQFVANLLERTADTQTLVLGPAAPRDRIPAARAFDASGSWRTLRAPGRLLPTSANARWLEQRLATHRPDVIVIASLWPLGRLAARLRRASGVPVLGITHGAEAGLAAGPTRPVLRTVARGVDLVTVISDHTAAAVGGALRGARVERLSPGVDPGRFARGHNAAMAAVLRERWGVPVDAPLVGCVARLVSRKGQDVLMRAWSDVRRRHPSARLVIVGEGPLYRRLERAAARLDGVHVVGPVTWEELPSAYAALDVFAMPVRTRMLGFDVEGLGISLLEAQAAGLPVIAGTSGGAPETVTDPRIGTVVDGRDLAEVTAAIDRWLSDPDARRVARGLGPELAQRWAWDEVAVRFRALIGDLAAR
jgi:phosphatidylinositol alpha-1,6-mannosyltransferase